MAGRVAAKTGSLGQDADVTDVKALSGVVPAEGVPGLVFSLVMNGGTVRDEATYQPIWSDLLDALGTYPSAPPVSDLDPGIPSRRRSLGDMTVLPMFPLGSVLLPGSVLPLHVFEPPVPPPGAGTASPPDVPPSSASR